MKALPPALTIVAVLAGSAFSWYSPVLWNVCNSAPAPGGMVFVNVDCFDSINPPRDEVVLKLFYSTDDQVTWHETPMSAVALPGYDSTYQCSFAIPSGGNVYYYIRGDNGTNYGTESPYNVGDIWPVPNNLLAEAALEGTGDTINDPDGEWLDLTSCAMGYSAGKFYGRLTNHSNQWPTRGSIVGPWYLYSVGFRNSEAYTADTLVYALTYANVLGIYTTGLYEINAITHDFTKVADIEVQTSGNRMVLRCNVADLAARRGFQPWPNQCGYLCSAKGETRSANAAMESWQHDTTNSSRFYVNKTPVFTVGQNTAPVLANPRVIPTHGMPGTEFRFTVRYTDADTHLPVRHSVVVDSDTFDLTPDHHGYWSIVTFEHARQFFTIGAHEFRFVFNDGMAVVTTPPDTFIVDDTLAVADESPAASGQSLSAVPNPFTGTTTIRLSPIASRSSPRILRIFDDCGKLIRSFDCSLLSAPSHLAWDARGLPAGTYFLREGNGPVRRLLVKLVH